MHAVHDYSTSWILQAIKTAVDICNRSRQTTLKGGIPKDVCSGKPAINDHLHTFGWNIFAEFKLNIPNYIERSVEHAEKRAVNDGQ